MSTITIRVIKSFPYRFSRNIILKNIEEKTLKTEDLVEMVEKEIQKNEKLSKYRKKKFDTLKVYTQAHGHKVNPFILKFAKTENLIINMKDDEKLILQKGKSLFEQNIKNETEISFFVLSEYLEYKKNPVIKW